MYQYISLLLIVWLTSASEVSGEKADLSPLVLFYYQTSYNFPTKGRITEDHKQEFYYKDEAEERFFCPDNNNVITKVLHFDNSVDHRDCLVEKEFEQNEEKLCKREVNPIIINYRIYTLSCETGKIYKVLYEICEKKLKTREQRVAEYDTTAYQVCFDHQQNRVLFTKHRIFTPDIFRNTKSAGETAQREFRQKYSTKTYGIEKFEDLKYIVKAYERQDSENKQVFQMLVPTDDFALHHLKKTTYFHVINYGLIHESKAAIWDAINSHVRSWIVEKISDESKNPAIYTGTSGEQYVGENKNNKLYLGYDSRSRTTIPKVWWKVLHSVLYDEAVVIIMHNDNDSEKICSQYGTTCEVTNWKTDQLTEEDFKNVYCCSLSSARKSIPELMKLGIEETEYVLKLV